MKVTREAQQGDVAPPGCCLILVRRGPGAAPSLPSIWSWLLHSHRADPAPWNPLFPSVTVPWQAGLRTELPAAGHPVCAGPFSGPDPVPSRWPQSPRGCGSLCRLCGVFRVRAQAPKPVVTASVFRDPHVSAVPDFLTCPETEKGWVLTYRPAVLTGPCGSQPCFYSCCQSP